MSPAILISAFNVTHLKDTELELQKVKAALQRCSHSTHVCFLSQPHVLTVRLARISRHACAWSILACLKHQSIEYGPVIIMFPSVGAEHLPLHAVCCLCFWQWLDVMLAVCTPLLIERGTGVP